MDMQLIQQMQSMGDPLEPARDVRHYLYFKASDQDAANRCARAHRQQGFNVEITPSRGDEDPPQTLVLANRDDSVLPEVICPVTRELRELAATLGGEYDGWEAALLKAKPRGIVGRLFGR